MYAQARKSKDKYQPIASGELNQGKAGKGTVQKVGNLHPATFPPVGRTIIANSDKINQLRAYQQMADSSPVVRQLKAYQALANSAPDQIDNKTKPDKGLQGKFNATGTSGGSETVLQRQIILGDAEAFPDELHSEVFNKTRGQVHGWLCGGEFDLSAKKAQDFLIKNDFEGQVLSLLERYDKENRSFDNARHLENQVIQDSKLIYLGLGDIAGIDYHGGQFSTSDKTGGERELRIYRTTTRGDWNNYLISKDIGGLLHGHGGGLGQALDYFYKSKSGAKDGPYYDNVLFEIKFTKKASSSIDYTSISSGGEGGGPSGGKLSGKKEQNDILGEANVFSVNLSACKALILSMEPQIRRVDEAKGEDTQYSKRLLEFALKKGEYPPSLTIEERAELNSLKAVG